MLQSPEHVVERGKATPLLALVAPSGAAFDLTSSISLYYLDDAAQPIIAQLSAAVEDLWQKVAGDDYRM